jgi:choline dehydrogenase-like flavoprotein
VPQPAGFGSPAHVAFNNLRALRRGELPARGLANLGALLGAPRDLGALLRARGGYHESRGGWSRAEVDRSRFHVIEVHAATEQSSDGENRVTLGNGRDRLDRRRAAVQWRWSRADRTNIERSLGLIVAGLESFGLGRFRRFATLGGPSRPAYRGIHHPMSSTRIAADPRDGVVDADLLVHGTTNLYVAGSSVFPNGHGYANPTLTILALSVRLADHIKGVLEQH